MKKYYVDNDIRPKISTEEPEYSVDVIVCIDGSEFEAYYDFDDRCWWVDWGGISVGHYKTSHWDIEYWRYS